jgi:hypothetical protein
MHLPLVANQYHAELRLGVVSNTINSDRREVVSAHIYLTPLFIARFGNRHDGKDSRRSEELTKPASASNIELSYHATEWLLVSIIGSCYSEPVSIPLANLVLVRVNQVVGMGSDQ